MLKTLIDETLQNYAPALAKGVQLHPFVVLEPGSHYFFIAYRSQHDRSDTVFLMWRVVDVIELLAEIKETCGSIVNFSLLTCSGDPDSCQPKVRKVSEFWMSSTAEQEHYFCRLQTEDGARHFFQGARTDLPLSGPMERLY